MTEFIERIITEATVVAAILTTGAIILAALLSSIISILNQRRQRTANYVQLFLSERGLRISFTNFLSHLEFFKTVSKHFPLMKLSDQFLNELDDTATGDILAICRTISDRVAFVTSPGESNKRYFVHEMNLPFVKGLSECQAFGEYEAWDNIVGDFKETLRHGSSTDGQVQSWMNDYVNYHYNHLIVMTRQPWFYSLFGPFPKIRNSIRKIVNRNSPFATTREWEYLVRQIYRFLAGAT